MPPKDTSRRDGARGASSGSQSAKPKKRTARTTTVNSVNADPLLPYGAEADADDDGPLLRSDSTFSVRSFGSALGDPDSLDAGVLVAPPGALTAADDLLYPGSLLDPSDSIDGPLTSGLGHRGHSSSSAGSSLAYVNSSTALNVSGVNSGADDGCGDDDADAEVAADEDTDIVDAEFSSTEHRAMIHLGLPAAVTYLCRLGMMFSDISILGRVSTDYLAGSAIGNTWMNITSSFCDRGVAAAFAVLSGQAYGARNYTLISLYLQQALVLMLCLSAPTLLLWAHAYPVLRVLGIEETEARLAAEFARWSMIKMVPLNIYSLLQRWMQVQQNVIPAMCVNLAFVGVNYGLNVALVHGWGPAGGRYSFAGLGFKGSPIATSITQTLVCVTFFAYILLSGSHKRTWRGWQLRRALRPARLKRLFVQQVVPLGLGGCFEEWQLEVVSLFAARMGKTLVATHNATLSLFVLLSSFMYGLIAAVSVRISQHLGAGAARRARAVSFYGLRASTAFGVVVALVFFLGRHHIARLFSSDPEVLHEASRIMTLTGACYLGMAIFYATMATLSGQGRPMVVAAAFLVGAWAVGVPAAWALAHPAGMKLLGLWIGLSCGYVVVTAITSVVVVMSDWSALAQVARDKAEVKSRGAGAGGGGAGDESDGENEGAAAAGDEGAPYQEMQEDSDGRRAGASV